MVNSSKTQKLTILAMMIALDVVLSPIFRIEGMAPMSSVINVTGAVLMGPSYVSVMALVCAVIRMTMMGIPPLALTGAFFGALLAGLGYRYTHKIWGAMLGEIIGTGLIGSLTSFPVMVWFTGNSNGMYWFLYTPRFFGGAISGSIIAFIVLYKLKDTRPFLRAQSLFQGVIKNGKLQPK